MNETVFDPTDKKLTIAVSEDQARLWFGEELLSQCSIECCDEWSDSKILAYFYLEARVNRGCVLNNHFNESIFTLILNTLKDQTGQDDFLTVDWDGLKYECEEYMGRGTLYYSSTTTDGYDLLVRYMTPGVAWQEIHVSASDEFPEPAEMYARLTGEREQEWVSNGVITYDGMTYSYDQAVSAVFTVKRRLQISDATGEVIFTNNDFVGGGIIDALIGLHRQFQLQLNYGGVAELTPDQYVALQGNVVHLLIDMFGMGDYVEPEDGTSHSIRGSVTPDVQCLISHTFVAEAGKVRADFRFFTITQNWSIEHSRSFTLGEPSVDVETVYDEHREQIRMALGLDLPEQPINALADIPFNNHVISELEPTMQPFTPLTPEEELAYYADSEVQDAGEPLDVTMVVAIGPRGGIGMGNELLFKTKEDMHFFRETTTNHVVIMGRKTFESIGKPLPNRQNIVITTDPEYVLNLYSAENDQVPENLHCVTSIEEAIMLGGRLATSMHGNNELMVIGGASIYEAFMPMCGRILMTSFHKADDSHADVFFPLSSADMVAQWHAAVLAGGIESDDMVYDRYELTRKQ